MTTLAHRLSSEPARFAAPALVVAGLLGSLWLADAWILLTGIGMFGPLLLREAGVLDWRDEFHREATLRACTHALPAVGILAMIVMTTQGFGGWHERKDLIGASTVLWVPALTWGLSAVLQVWGSPEGAFRLLLASTVVVLVVASTRFVLFGTATRIAIHDNPPSTPVWIAIICGLLGLVALSRFRPRITGWLLLLIAALAAVTLQGSVAYIGGATRGWTKSVDVLLIVAPLLIVVGLSLVQDPQRTFAGEEDMA